MKSKIISSIFAAVLMASSALAAATPQNQNPCGNSGNNCNTGGAGGNGGNGGAGGQGGAGGSATGIGVGIGIAGAAASATGGNATANSNNLNANTNSNRNTNTQGQAQGQQQGQGQSQSATSSSGGNSQSNAGNNTSVSIAGDTVERAAPAAYAPNASAPVRSCRIMVGFGGSGTGGAISGGVPIGNDQTCLSGVALEMMDRINRLAPGTFQTADYKRAACKVEGMEAMDGCKAPAKAAAAPATPVASTGSDYDQRAYAANQRGEPLDAIVRKNRGLAPL